MSGANDREADGHIIESTRPPFARRAALAAPFLLFAALAGLLFYKLDLTQAKLSRGLSDSELPSALINKKAPEFALDAVAGLQNNGKPTPGFTSKDLAAGKVTLVNVWSSWCGPCKYEHPLLAPLKERSGVQLFGIDYKDNPEAALRMITKAGNPFDAVGGDVSGRVSIDWGVTGVPETFVIDGSGKIVFKLGGPITPENIDALLMPAINKARASQS